MSQLDPLKVVVNPRDRDEGMEAPGQGGGGDAGLEGAGWGEAHSPLPPAIETLDGAEQQERERDREAEAIHAAEVEAERSRADEHDSEIASDGPPRLSEGIPSGHVAIVIPVESARTLVRELSAGRAALLAEIANARSDKAADMFKTRQRRLGDVELSARAVLMDLTLHDPDESENA